MRFISYPAEGGKDILCHANDNDCTLGCFIISPLSTFQTATDCSDWIFDADYEFGIILYYDVIFMVPRAIVTSFFAVFLLSRESFVI